MAGPRTDVRRRRNNTAGIIGAVIVLLLAAGGLAYFLAGKTTRHDDARRRRQAPTSASQTLRSDGLVIGSMTHHLLEPARGHRRLDQPEGRGPR